MLHLDDGMLNALLDRELSGPELRQAEAHLQGCAECAARLEDYRQVMGEADALIEAIQVPPAPVGQPVRSPAPWWVRYRPVGLAAGLLLAAGLGYLVLDRNAAGPPGAVSPAGASPGLASNSGPATESPGRQDEPPAGPPASTPSRPPDDALADQAPAPGAQAGAGGAPAAIALQEARDAGDSAEGAGVSSPEESARRDLAAAPPVSGAPGRQSASGFRAQDAQGAVASKMVGGVRTDSAATGNRLAAERRAREAAAPAVTEPGYERITMDEAVVRLGGAVRLIDGWTPDHVEAPTRHDSTGPMVRVVYRDPQGTLLLLDQRRSPGPLADRPQHRAEAEADEAGGMVTLAWTEDGFWLALSGPVSADSLARLKGLVR